MSIVITTPTGHIGRAVVQNLLDRKQQVTLIARQPDKVADLAERGAKVVKGTHDDAALLTEASKGAEALFLVTPPDLTSTDVRATYRRFGAAAVKAITANKIPHVVHLSSVGAELETGTGVVLGLNENERILREAATNLVQLRPGYFMENTLMQIGSILQAGKLFTNLPGGAKLAMVATRDIGARAAQLLVERTWKGEVVVELQGPTEISYDEVARVLSEVLGRSIEHVTIPSAQLKQAMMGMGASEHIADGFAALGDILGTGRMKFHTPRGPQTSTPTTYAAFAREVFKPAFEAAQRG
jgi:uncharacterized protein YbjT (DUF2867 family)